jgi:hypothetical protein
MMRSAALALASVCVLAACNQSAPSASNNTGGLFPDLTHAAYRAEATITGADGSSVPVVSIRDGQKQRIEFDAPQGRTIMILNGEGDSYMISSAGGHTMAVRMTGLADQAAQFRDPTKDWTQDLATSAQRGGACSGAGETGTEWTRENNGVTSAACVTNDGIILSARQGERTVWQTTRVQRGPQSADQFTLPPGVQVVDMGNMGQMSQAVRDAVERARASSGK